jgi:hypothetical protein
MFKNTRAKLDRLRRRKTDCPGAAGDETTRQYGLRVHEREDVGERYIKRPKAMALATLPQAEQVACFPGRDAASPFPVLSGGR